MHKMCDKRTIVESSGSSSSANASVVFVNYSGPSSRCRSLQCVPWIELWSYPQSRDYLPFGLLTSYFVWWRFAFVTVGRASLPWLVGYDTVENSWGVNWIPRYFKRSIQSFCSSLIFVICDIEETGKRSLKLATKWKYRRASDMFQVR